MAAKKKAAKVEGAAVGADPRADQAEQVMSETAERVDQALGTMQRDLEDAIAETGGGIAGTEEGEKLHALGCARDPCTCDEIITGNMQAAQRDRDPLASTLRLHEALGLPLVDVSGEGPEDVAEKIKAATPPGRSPEIVHFDGSRALVRFV